MVLMFALVHRCPMMSKHVQSTSKYIPRSRKIGHIRALAQVTDYMDPVPHLPPSWLMGYRHAGPEAESYGELVLDFRIL